VLFLQDDSEDGFDKSPSEKDDFGIHDLMGSLKRENAVDLFKESSGRATPRNSR
jgi:hypothetical protein